MSLQTLAVEIANLIAGDTLASFVRFPHRVTEFYDLNLQRFTTTDASNWDLTPAYTDPGFLDTSGNPFTGPALQGLLDDLLAERREPGNVIAASKGNIAIAMVSMQGNPSNLASPELALWQENRAFDAASTAKLAILYALFQLQSEMGQLVAEQPGITTVQGLQREAERYWKAAGRKDGFPKLAQLFEITPTREVEFTLDVLNDKLTHFSGPNSVPNALLRRIGFPYVGSLMLQSGIYDPVRGGIWLGGDYSKHTAAGTMFQGNPVRGAFPQNVTALSAVRLFTLMAQRRLVSRAASDTMLSTLQTYPGGCFVQFAGGNRLLPPVQAAKCGITPSRDGRILHDVFLYDDGARRYVMALLSQNVPYDYLAIRTRLMQLP